MLSSIFKKFWRLELPNITGSIIGNTSGNQAPIVYNKSTTDGSFDLANSKSSNGAGYGSSTGYYSLYFNATNSNAIYKDINTVQPISNQVLIIIKT